MHPKEAEHQEIAARKREMEEHRRQVLSHLTDKHRLRFVHIRRIDQRVGPNVLHNKGGMTLAYQLPYKGRGCVIDVSTALVHDNDAYCKRTGRYYAATCFDDGRRVALRVPKNMGASTFLKQLFAITIKRGEANGQ